ncbi:hypothetical protein HD597_005778 [Nonomuraea thailandensis]|uniref:Uncharacterized protein n=1 Tax=Nonomuraea thailandensis TaxID=1188745 RepID=A0A9X2GQ43_9ACTN|nr:hypothetical protein [Nonomuraea thailandensis]
MKPPRDGPAAGWSELGVSSRVALTTKIQADRG